MSDTPTVTVPARFCGPPRSGNGGWTAGAVAASLLAGPGRDTAVTVALRMPPPLDSPFDLERDGEVLTARHDGAVVATARPGEEPTPVARVGVEEARAAAARYPGLARHPFPTCVVCGTGREPGDGLRIFTGPLAGDRSAATWTPDASTAAPDGEHVTTAVTWAAVDCPGAWAADIGERLMVLGTMTARVHRPAVVGVEHVVVGELRGREGRKTFTGASLYDVSGTLVAAAEHVWIAVGAADFT